MKSLKVTGDLAAVRPESEHHTSKDPTFLPDTPPHACPQFSKLTLGSLPFQPLGRVKHSTYRTVDAALDCLSEERRLRADQSVETETVNR